MELPYSNMQLKYRNPGAELPLVLPVHVVCNVADELIEANVRENIAAIPGGWVKSLPAHDRTAVICGSGPSLRETVGEIPLVGADIFALNGAASLLARYGLMPEYQVIVDARARTAELVGPARQYLFASQVHPRTLRRVPEARLWHQHFEGIDDLITESEDEFALVGGGVSVGLSAMCLAYTLGYRKLVCFGYDSSYTDGRSHAMLQPMNEGEPVATVSFGGKEYLASFTMKVQAERFPSLARQLMQLGCSVEVRGRGLLPDVFNAPAELLDEQGKYERMWSFPQYRRVAPGELLIDRFLALLPPASRVIDFGCGTGRAALRMHQAGHRVVAIDFAANCRDPEAQEVSFLQWDLTDPLPIHAEFGYCTDVLEHIPPGQVEAVVHNLLNAADTVFFQISTVPDALGELIGQPLHLTVRPADWWAQLFARLGAKVEQFEVQPEAVIFLAKGEGNATS
ncbi:MAG: protein of unknown function DUF115 [Siphoviridae sp. ctdEk19]|nr:MAG: protein of unknown function DUF115 [Siphoviridae sp. ctdEk19]